MRILFLVLSIGAVMFSCKPAPSKLTAEQLKDSVVAELGKQQGIFAVAFKNLTTGEEVLINEHQLMHAASTMKTPVMIEVYKQAAEGKFKLTDSLVIKNEFRSIVDSSAFSLSAEDDSEKELYNQVGKKKTVYDLMYDMIIVSSNLATNQVLELVNPKKVTATIRELGAKDMVVLRGVEDLKAFERGLINTATAYDLMKIYEAIAGGKAVDAQSSQAMMDILLKQQFNEIIPAKLPADVKVAHKTGSITGVHHDSGIVILPDGKKYVVVIMGKELKDEPAAVKMMADVSGLIYRYVAQQQ